MKRILVVLFSLICFIGYAQTPYPTPPQQQGSKGVLVGNQGGQRIDSTLIPPVYSDTAKANRSKTSLYPGSVIRVGDDYYYRSADTTKWLLIATTTSNCAGTQLISGSITWSGSGLVYDATDLDYYILCSRYFANSTTLTLAVADPTFPRIDKFYADITGAIGVITGTPATNPQEPQVNMLNQIDLGFVYIPAGSTVPAGTTQTVIYNENVEWTGTSDVPSVNFDYATNPYIGTVSTYLPNAPNSSYVEWQSGGIDYLFSEAQYLKFWVRLNANFVSDPLSFLDVTFEYTDVTVSQTLAVGNGDYNMDYSLINQWQLVSIPLTGITTFGADFNSVHFVINSAPSSFQLDYVYILETATVPPVISSGWALNLNTGTNPTTNGIGTSDSVGVAIKTNSQTRLIFPANGIVELSNDELDQQLLTIRNDTIYKTNIPTAYGTLPIVVEIRNDSTFITCPTCDTTGGSSGWSLTGNAITTGQFLGTTNSEPLVFKFNGNDRGIISGLNTAFGSYISAGFGNSGFGDDALLSTTVNTDQNTALGAIALQVLDNGDNNVAVGYNSLSGISAGTANTAIGAETTLSTLSSTDSAVAIGYEAVAATKQLAFSPHLTTMFLDLDSASGTAPAIAGIDENGNWRKYATPSGTTLTNTYVGVGNVSNVVSGSADLTWDGSILNISGQVIATDYTGTWGGDPVNEVYGGTNQSTYTTGDILYASASNTLSKLGIGTAAQSLRVVGGVPVWRDTLAVSGVYAPLASPTFTGTVNLPATTFNGILSSNFNASFNNMTLLAGLAIPKTITAGGTTGAQTINKPTGSVNFAAGATTLVVTNSYVSSTSLVIVQVYGTDVTATTARVTLAAGSFTITLNAAATAETKVGFFVTN